MFLDFFLIYLRLGLVACLPACLGNGSLDNFFFFFFGWFEIACTYLNFFIFYFYQLSCMSWAEHVNFFNVYSFWAWHAQEYDIFHRWYRLLNRWLSVVNKTCLFSSLHIYILVVSSHDFVLWISDWESNFVCFPLYISSEVLTNSGWKLTNKMY